MQGMKGALIAAALVATAAALGACGKNVPAEPMKLGATDVPVAEQVAK